ncbi:P-loop NTPase fold protein [Streptococcus parasuis]|uniref:P-loop NTPase fold protein n=1 Tax=Streptococcus parasuis TaxID=1501662 RepID=UPI00370DDB35
MDQSKKDCKYQTFFLNGVWGSGKTSFLENINTIETDDNEINGKEFIFLKLPSQAFPLAYSKISSQILIV